MKNKRMHHLLALMLLGIAPLAAPASEPPLLAARVAAGELAPMAQRLPQRPAVAALAGERLGRHGGTLRLLMGREKDTRLMVVYGYARLVGYDSDYELRPDILEAVEERDGREFTLRLRPGHRWSDGQPFTSEDFRYFWEDVALDPDLSPFGPPAVMLVAGEPPAFEVLDAHTVRYAWKSPNPFFLPALAGARPEYIYAPAHYLKAFHSRYTPIEKLEARARAEGRRNWASVHTDRFHPYKNDDPALPTLDPWVLKNRPPSQRYLFERNPYYHRADARGLQLPYIDQVVMNIADGKLIPAKAGAGESDLQARHLAFSDYTFLKESEARAPYQVYLWRTTRGSHMALYPNLNARDPVWRALLRDVRVRRALSLAIDRGEINQVIYYGLAEEGNDTVFSESPLFKPEYRERWAGFDLERANSLLDQAGLVERNSDGIRLLPDGRPMELIVETAGEDSEQTDVLQLIEGTWRKAGVKLFAKPEQREVFRNRIFSGEALMSVWSGLENGLPTAAMSPEELAPTSQQQLMWPKWGQFRESGGAAGEAPDLPPARRLLELNQAWLEASSVEARRRAWHEMLEIRAEQTFSIGLVAGVPQPVVVSRSLRNVPPGGIYNWDPGAHFGIYRPDGFWLTGE